MNPAREWLQRVFGRSLGEDEQVTIFVATPHAACSGQDHRTAFQRMDRVLDKAAENMKSIPDDDFDQAVDEAMRKLANPRVSPSGPAPAAYRFGD